MPAPRLNATLGALLSTLGGPASPHLDVGIFGAAYVFDVLREYDLDDVALRVLNTSTYPSFGHFVSEGATTLWEAWEGNRTFQKPGTSRNHIMYGGGVGRFIAASVGGLAPLEAGWSRCHVKIAHSAVRNVRQASAARPTPFGPVRVEWRAAEDLLLHVTLPAGATAAVDLPLPAGKTDARVGGCSLSCRSGASPSSSGGHPSACAGYAVSGCRQVPLSGGDAFLRVEVGAGSHSFAVPAV